MGRVFFYPPPWDDYTFCARWRPGVRSGALFALDCTSPSLTALRAQFTPQKITQQVFVADGDSFSATFFSPSFQRDFVCVKTPPLGEVFLENSHASTTPAHKRGRNVMSLKRKNERREGGRPAVYRLKKY